MCKYVKPGYTLDKLRNLTSVKICVASEMWVLMKMHRISWMNRIKTNETVLPRDTEEFFRAYHEVKTTTT